MALLEVENLNVRFDTPDGEVHAVKDLSFALDAQETLGIVGESGSGKSQTMLGLIGLLATNGKASGRATFDGEDLLALEPAALRALRGREISMIFQDPMTSLNPYLTIAEQMSEVVRTHERVSRKAARARCLAALESVQIPEARARLDRYPHELSGGMRQRVMIAASLLLHPRLLIADEPTTALDVTVQAQILDLLKTLKAEFETSIILITHDLGVVAGIADRVLVMHGGELKEHGRVDDVFYAPQHPYTQALLRAVPRLDETIVTRLAAVDPGAAAQGTLAAPAAPGANAVGEQRPPASGVIGSGAPGKPAPLLEIDDLGVQFKVRANLFGAPQVVRAVDGVSLTLAPGETLGIVGESGCGKSTLARAVLDLVPISAGRVCVLGRDLHALDARASRALKRDLQVIFQDPLAALNPRMTVGDIVAEPLWTHRPELDRKGVRAQVRDVLKQVGLSGRELNRYPHEFSGGQCQRIGIARALVLKPKLVICDEPVSALDVSIRAQIVNLLMDLREVFGLSLIFIAHDLAVVRHISDRVLVMYLGKVMEIADRKHLYDAPGHPYTRALISSVPIPDPRAERSRVREILKGDLPSPIRPPSGCRFRTRCKFAIDRCAAEVPALRPVALGLVACHRAEELAEGQL